MKTVAPVEIIATPLYAGIMTGTSLDAADVALCCEKDGLWELQSSAHAVMPRELSDKLRQMNDNTPLSSAMDAANAVARLCAKALMRLPSSQNITAIGCHGQTVLHNPARGWTVQLLNGALLAELTETDVVCDFRSRDIAAGGQGAPLAPLFHQEVFGKDAPCAIINLGGIANITVLSSKNKARGWDIGPASMLMDAWVQKHLGKNFDHNGAWAAGGIIKPKLLTQLMKHPFLSQPPPKSCGREEFDLLHFEKQLADVAPRDAQATLLEWSAQLTATAINNANVQRAFVCGGGARNRALVARIAALSTVPMRQTDDKGIPAQLVEAAAFAWLAKQCLERTPLELSPVTGASGARIIGAHYPA